MTKVAENTWMKVGVIATVLGTLATFAAIRWGGESKKIRRGDESKVEQTTTVQTGTNNAPIVIQQGSTTGDAPPTTKPKRQKRSSILTAPSILDD